MIPIKNTVKACLLAPVLLVLLFEEWGWEPLAQGFAKLTRHPAWAVLERRIRQLPPRVALLAFGGPVMLLVPFKLLALYLLAEGHLALGVGLVIVAKLTGTALAARLFQLTEPALMQLRWFARLYTPWKSWKNRLLARVRSSALWYAVRHLKARVKSVMFRAWAACKTLLS